MSDDYWEFLATKAVKAPVRGLDPDKMPEIGSHLFPFQRKCVEHALHVGAAGTFLDTGLGKTLVQLEWAARAMEHANGRALILTPLAVARQIEREGLRFGYPVRVIREQSDARDGINICNYDRLDRLDHGWFGVVALDEASILKSFTGKTTRALIEAFRGHRWKMAATATPAPNDHMELGQYCEFLSVMASNEMLMRWFIADQTEMGRYRLKGHAINSFWDWMASWARMAQLPSDLGDDDEGFALPPLNVQRHRAADSKISDELSDMFGVVAMNATTVHSIKRQTIAARADVVVRIIQEGGLWMTGPSTPDATISPTKKSGRNPLSSLSSGESSSASVTQKTPTTGSASKAEAETQERRIRLATRGGGFGSSSESGFKTTGPCSSRRTTPVRFVDRESREGNAATSTSIIATQPEPSEDCFAADAISGSGSSATTQKILSGRLSISEVRMPRPWLLWCDTNEEQDQIESALSNAFGPNSFFSIRGSDAADDKEDRAFAWVAGERPILVTKASIFGWGMNFQHCADMAFVGRSYSYESYYQAVRRCWRFGQKRAVNVHIVVAEGEAEIGRVIDRKASDHAKMKAAMKSAMARATEQRAETKVPYSPNRLARIPAWLKSAV